jgi:hypothetical protein
MHMPLGIEPATLCALLLQDEEVWKSWALEIVSSNPGLGFNALLLTSELRQRRRLMFAIESYLMANRGTESFPEFLQRVTQLTVETLAYSLADDAQKSALVGLFNTIAHYVEGRDAAPGKQAEYAKTILGIEVAQEIETWTSENRDSLLSLDSNEGLLATIWPLLTEHSQDKFFTSVLPQSLPIELATMWLQGQPYQDLFAYSVTVGGTKPWGITRRKLQDDDIIEFCESTLGFECPLFIAAIAQFLFGDLMQSDNAAAPISLFHKALKYGIPDVLAISCFESGFADRMLAQVLRDSLLNDRYTGQYTGDMFTRAIEPHRETLVATLSDYPSYFETVLGTIV